MRIAVTGKYGQVAQSLVALGPEAGAEILAVGRPELDLDDPYSVYPALKAVRPDIIVSAAAYTQVDRAESERDLSFGINALGAGAVAQAAVRLGVPVIHLSTDYVFDGYKSGAYVEGDQTVPQSVYGASKLEGEARVARATQDHVILRTAWIYSLYGQNFLKTMLRLGETRDTVSVVADQMGSPTSAEDIASAILIIARKLRATEHLGYRGLFHLAATGSASWADFAERIFAVASECGHQAVDVRRIATCEYPTTAVRPANSRLSCGKIKTIYGIELPDWRHSTAKVVRTLLRQSATV